MLISSQRSYKPGVEKSFPHVEHEYCFDPRPFFSVLVGFEVDGEVVVGAVGS